LRRRQLFEVLDQPWCPEAVRQGATDFLEAITSRGNIYRGVQAEFVAAMVSSGANRVVDLCSGSGGPWLSASWRTLLAAHPPLTVVLTDKFPIAALASRLSGDPLIRTVETSVDATSVPDWLGGFRTVFSSFHHFSDPVAIQVLQDSVRSGAGFAMAEVTSRTLRAMLKVSLMPVFCWLLTPQMKPFRWSRILLTYPLPVIPAVLLWDGLVSCLRTRTPEELLLLTRSFPQYNWQAGYASEGWLPPVYLIGTPATSS
jgi:hypothetical protein